MHVNHFHTALFSRFRLFSFVTFVTFVIFVIFVIFKEHFFNDYNELLNCLYR